jgi:DNA-binding GntR family transcriptional regulator
MDFPRDLDSVLTLPANRGLGADIAARLRLAILNGYFDPGARLPEESLARTMGVSRGPIREALVQLEREGLIVIRRNRGAFVAQLAREDLEEVYTLRVAIEQLAVQRAVALAKDDAIAEMQAVVDDIAARMERGITEQEAAELDLHFHDLIYRAANHRRLYETWTNLRPQIHIILLNRNVAHEDFREMVVPSHQVILDAIRDRDEARAVELTLEHLHGSYERVLRRHAARASDTVESTDQLEANGRKTA